MSNVKVLFFGADPLSADGRKHRLLLDEETREIEQEVIAALHRDRVDFRTCWATRIGELRRSLMRHKPDVVHFSGHGGEEGLVLVSSDGLGARRVGADPLQHFFKEYGGQVRLVVLNACNSQPQAQAIAQVVGCAIGTRAKIKDQAAIAFSAAFYSSIAFGESVEKAFNQACATLRMEGYAENELPVLETRDGVDPSTLVLLPPESRRPRTRMYGATVAAAAMGGWMLWPPTQPPACRTASAVLDSIRATHGAVQPQGLMASGIRAGHATETMARAVQLYEAGDYAAAFPLFMDEALRGDAEAESYVGIAYLRGQGVEADADSAAKWLAWAKKTRDPRGMNAVGEAYQRGIGFGRSDRSALHWYQESANKGFPEAIRNVAGMYRDGRYVPVDGGRALALYQEAAKAGFVDAMADVGAMYEHGLAVAADPRAARCWYDAAAGAGSAAGMVELGRIHEARGKLGAARAWYERAAEAGSEAARTNLARLRV